MSSAIGRRAVNGRHHFGSQKGVKGTKGVILLGRRHPLEKCVCCLTRIGLGVKSVGKITGKNPGLILRWRKRNGIIGKVRSSSNGGRSRLPASEYYERACLDDVRQHSKFKDHWANHPLITQARNRAKARAQWWAKKTNDEWRIGRYTASQAWRKANGYNWGKKNPLAFRSWKRSYIERNPEIKLIRSMRCRMRDWVKKGRRIACVEKVLGCSRQVFRDRIASMFTEGMSWANYGAWHLDHITPCAAFNQSDPIEFACCWRFDNFQPLWAADNLAKSDSM